MPKASVKRNINKKKDKLIEFVLDIEKYPEFIPFCLDSKVYDRKEENNQILIIADLTIGKVKDDNDKYRFTVMHLQNGESRTGKFKETSSIENSFVGSRDNLEYSQRSITSALFNGQHSREDNKLKIDWRIAPTFSSIADKEIGRAHV